MKIFKKRSLAVSLILLIILPLLLILFIPTVFNNVEAGNAQSNRNSWLKGLLLIVISYFTNNFLENSQNTEEDKKAEESIVIDRPLIDEKEIEEEKVVLGFYVNWINSYANSFNALQKNYQNIDLVAPFWYTVNPDGSLSSRYGGHQHEMVQLASKNEMDVIPLINNNQKNHMVLLDDEIRQKAVMNIVNLLRKYDYAGVNIDFEFIPPWTRDGYTKFIKQLHQELKKFDMLLTVSVFPKINVPLDLHGAYDYEAISPYIDYMVIMTYDHNWSSGNPGPIAPLSWVEDNIIYARQYIPENKILLGIANYGYDWKEPGQGNDLGAIRAKELAREKNVPIKWDEKAKTPFFYYQDEQNQQREVWFESSYSLEYKLDLVEKYNLKGIGIWRLGNAKDRFWEVIEDRLK